MKYQPTLNTKEKRVNDMKEYQRNYRSKNKNLMDKEKAYQNTQTQTIMETVV